MLRPDPAIAIKVTWASPTMAWTITTKPGQQLVMSLASDTERELRIAQALRAPLEVNFVNRKVFETGTGARDEVVTTSRLILVLNGTMTYKMEGRVFHLKPGTQFLVPAWVRRFWTVPAKQVCEIIWCIFDDNSTHAPLSGFASRRLNGSELPREKRAYLEMLRAYDSAKPGEHTPLQLLAMEAMLKAMLGRFWMNADLRTSASAEASPLVLHPAVKQALRWLDRHYMEKDVLETLYARGDLTPNYLRKHFKDGMKCSPQEHLQRLRLRHARHLIHSTQWQQKRIAAEVGYDDPLYFSRLYTRFWKHSPSEERAMIKRRR